MSHSNYGRSAGRWPDVGQNMADHIFSCRVNVETSSRMTNDPTVLAAQVFGPYLRQQGVLTSPVCDYLGWA